MSNATKAMIGLIPVVATAKVIEEIEKPRKSGKSPRLGLMSKRR